ncbi:HAMP domain-containing sensor histidine kinase [Faunimonas sp. B44]|uniref:HAMP domain-containing sensor histidine kinase n=1 Tax=Faunimonas sp. B44 TaxID=3461493 RepID=UPI004044DAE0
MSLLVGLISRLVLVASISLTFAVGWVIVDTNRTLQKEITASADRAARQVTRLMWLGSARKEAYLHTFSAREAMAVLTVMGPGICMELSPGIGPHQRLCSGWDTFGPSAPAWFARLFGKVFDPGPAVRRPVIFERAEAASVVAKADPVAAMTWAWSHVRVMIGMAAAMALAISALSGILIVHALSPIDTIIRGLRQLAGGDLSSRLPGFRTTEFRRIGEAFNAMAAQLEETSRERDRLTSRIFEVQEEERKALARDLHDEFGQCLSAVGALAASIEAGARDRQSDLAIDARRIGEIAATMMATLRGAFARLRPPDLDELGLEASLRTMLRNWRSPGAGPTEFRLEVTGDLSALPKDAALGLYRIAQEGVTNAARHSTPRQVTVTIKAPAHGQAGLELSVQDDGGGSPDALGATKGYGIVGIRERVRALGGTVSFARSGGGLRLDAFFPFPARPTI